MKSATQSRIYALATMDTKGEEIAFVASALRLAGVEVVTVDVGTGAAPVVTPDIPREKVLAAHPQGRTSIGLTDRAGALAVMSEALEAFLTGEHAADRLAGTIGLGGTGGTALLTAAMRSLPLGVPKIMVSTVAGGDVSAYVQGSDIVMFPSIVDIAGLNSVSSAVLTRAAGAVAGMVLARPPQVPVKPAVGITMLGVTTPCVTARRGFLEAAGWDVLVFHATGAGGRAMEALVEAGLISAVIDVTTTEVADEVVGGVFPAGPGRFDTILRRGIPYVVSLGALDMVNFWAPETIPARFADRMFHRHNANVTLMRTTPEENRAFARWIAVKLNRAAAPWTLLVPEGGVSLLDVPGQPFHDPKTDGALFDELDHAIEIRPGRTVIRRTEAINDPAFAEALANVFFQLCPHPRLK
jgi:uncharacterized protein (UPF0261 family)